MIIAATDLCTRLLFSMFLFYGDPGPEWRGVSLLSSETNAQPSAKYAYPAWRSANDPSFVKPASRGKVWAVSYLGSFSGRPERALSDLEKRLFPFVREKVQIDELHERTLAGADAYLLENFQDGARTQIHFFKSGPLYSVSEPLHGEDAPPPVRAVLESRFNGGAYSLEAVWLGAYEIEEEDDQGNEREWIYDSLGNLLFEITETEELEDVDLAFDRLPEAIRAALNAYDPDPIQPIKTEFEQELDAPTWSIEWRSGNGINEISLMENGFPLFWERPTGAPIPAKILEIAKGREVDGLLVRLYVAHPIEPGGEPLAILATGRIVEFRDARE